MTMTPEKGINQPSTDAQRLVMEIALQQWNARDDTRREYFFGGNGECICYEIGGDELTDDEGYEEAVKFSQFIADLGDELWAKFCDQPPPADDGGTVDEDEAYEAFLIAEANRDG